MTQKYIVGLLDPADNKIKLSQSCADGPAIAAAARALCERIGWDPLEHYDEDFYETLEDTSELDTGQLAFIDLWDSNLIAAIVVIREDYQAAAMARLAEVWER